MASLVSYDSTVAARTRAAEYILTNPGVLAAYDALGGLNEDLQKIAAAGHDAEALNLAQSQAQAAGGAGTLAVLKAFAAVQKEYNAVMAVVQAVRNDLADAKATDDVIKQVDKILVNEAETYFATEKGPDDKTKKVARKRATQEALRAEIAKDAHALSDLSAAHAALAKRKVDQPRLHKLADDADALAGSLAERSARKGGQHTATQAEHDAVSAQKKAWSAHYRLLAALGRQDAQIAKLLGEAKGPRKTKSKK